MSEFLTALNKLDFVVVIWLFPCALAIHVTEELAGNIASWYQQNFAGLPPKINVSIPTFLLFATSLTFVLTGIIVALGSPNLAAWLLLPLAVPIFWNALQHIYHSFYFWQYVPGAITSLLFLLPSISYLAIRAVKEDLVSLWFIDGLALAIAMGFIHTLTAGKKLTAEFMPFHRIGITLSKLLPQSSSQ
jgi:hypothetical protein